MFDLIKTQKVLDLIATELPKILEDQRSQSSPLPPPLRMIRDFSGETPESRIRGLLYRIVHN